MVFYELHILLSRRVGRAELQQLLQQQQQIIAKHHGSLLEVRDLGFRETAFRIKKARESPAYFGRVVAIAFGAKPTAVAELDAALQATGGVLRHTTQKLRYRSNFLTYNCYKHRPELPARQPTMAEKERQTESERASKRDCAPATPPSRVCSSGGQGPCQLLSNKPICTASCGQLE
ncbi:uncharacterized protein LOC113147493 [Cyclospora cayetanensis]|uniref:Uncharacterized protein LOC113147493 n=1 Tax=Cyclospora cayetanensis TaxID=88456 RepID=A0A6P6S1G8_9EIME|nr:uncharacterized protein LOC113147493 [Cyclospora cayetanensis]